MSVERYDHRSHLVILGAGATCAAFPNGDYNGKRIPPMNRFLERTGISSKFPELIDYIGKYPNLEDLYSKLTSDPIYATICKNLNLEIFNYMSSLHCGAEINLYDKLVLSLTKRDTIATFNWDPFLSQSLFYMSYVTRDLPNLLFLHGNVAMGICENCKRIGYVNNTCNSCNQVFTPLRLLYPVKEKNYEQNLYIKDAWDNLKRAIDDSWMITFFGYSAPKSDTAAITMMEKTFEESKEKGLKQFEIINIDDEKNLTEAYSIFAYKPTRISYIKNFYDSSLAKNPRRTCDCLYSNTMLCEPTSLVDDSGNNIVFKEEDELCDLADKIKQIEGKKILRDCYIKKPLQKVDIIKEVGWSLRGISTSNT